MNVGAAGPNVIGFESMIKDTSSRPQYVRMNTHNPALESAIAGIGVDDS